MWAPDDSAIVYRRGFSLWQMRTDGTRQRLLLANGISPSWSPGATRIAFIRGGDPWIANRNGKRREARRARADAADLGDLVTGRAAGSCTGPIDRGDLVLVQANGASTTSLTRQPGFFNADPSWQRVR